MASSREIYQKKQRLFLTEATVVIVVNCALAIAAGVALVRLVSYNLAQKETVEVLDAEVKDTQARVSKVREEFSQYFDPQQTPALMRQQSHRVEAGQARIVLTEPDGNTSDGTVPDKVMPDGTVPTRNAPDEVTPDDEIEGEGEKETAPAEPQPRNREAPESRPIGNPPHAIAAGEPESSDPQPELFRPSESRGQSSSFFEHIGQPRPASSD